MDRLDTRFSRLGFLILTLSLHFADDLVRIDPERSCHVQKLDNIETTLPSFVLANERLNAPE